MTTPGSLFTSFLLLILYVTTSPLKSQHISASSESSVTTNGKETYRWKSSSPTANFEIELRGKVELTDDDRDIKRISDGGYLEISKTVFGSKRSIRIESLGSGHVSREYFEGRTKMPWEPNGKQWLGEILPEVVRTSTIGSEGRVKRLFSKGGTSAVLSEIDQIESDHVKAHYGKLLMKYPVKTTDYPMVIQRVTGDMDSDHYITDFLQVNVNKFLQSSEAVNAMFTAAREMDSDHYKTIVISEALRNKATSREGLQTALKTAAEMDSDHYIAEVLLDVLRQNNVSPDALSGVITTTKAIESDHYRTVVLKQALSRNDLPNEAHQKLLESVKEMSSDHYITEVIVDLTVNRLSDESMNDLLDLLPSVDSDHYRGSILKKLLEEQQLTDNQLEVVLEVSADMSSDHYKTEVLKEVLARTNTPGTVMKVLNSLGQIGSDHYATEVLLSAAPRVKGGNNDLKDAYRQAARRISSDHYYGRALKAIEQ